MYHPHRVNIKYLIAGSTAIATILSYVVLHFIGDDFFSLVLRIGLISQFPTIAWVLFERHFWRVPWLNPKWSPLYLPDLNGRWEGFVQRADESISRSFVIEIKQTYTRTKYKTFSSNSTGGSLHVAIMRGSEDAEDIKLYCYWETTTRGLANPETTDRFKGYSVMDLNVDEDGKMMLDDIYFTERNPPTRGRLKLVFVSRKRLGRIATD